MTLELVREKIPVFFAAWYRDGPGSLILLAISVVVFVLFAVVGHKLVLYAMNATNGCSRSTLL